MPNQTDLKLAFAYIPGKYENIYPTVLDSL